MTKADTNLFITIAIAVVVLAGVSLFGIQPLLGRLSKLQTERKKTTEELNALQERSDILAALAKDSRAIKDLGERATGYLPETIASSPFLMDIAAIAGQSGAGVPSISFQTSETKKGAGSGLTSYPVNMSVEGNYDSLTTFLQFLEENLRFSDYTSVVITQREDGQAMQLVGSIYGKAKEKTPKDQSLSIDKKAEELLKNRKQFGAEIDTGGNGRANPFAQF